MKLVRHFYDPEELRRAINLLHAKGIPTHLKYSGAPSVWPTPYRAAMFVCLDRHLRDAVMVLQDPEHKVSEPVDVGAYLAGLEAQGTSPTLVKWTVYVLLGCIGFFVLAVWLGESVIR